LTQPNSVKTKRYVSRNWLSIPVTCGTRNAVIVDGTRVYAIQQDGSIKVATTGQTASTAMSPEVKGNALWIAADNRSLLIAAPRPMRQRRNQVTITVIGN
jgi:hypothetical protein